MKPDPRRHVHAAARLLLASACGLLAVPAHAQVQATGEYLARMDADGDGRVSLAEYQDWMGYAFAAMDRDGDPGRATGTQTGSNHASSVKDGEILCQAVHTINVLDSVASSWHRFVAVSIKTEDDQGVGGTVPLRSPRR